jgi:hypothetical protein
MGYNVSAQASLAGFSHYQLLHGRDPVVPVGHQRNDEGAVGFGPDSQIGGVGGGAGSAFPAMDARGNG